MACWGSKVVAEKLAGPQKERIVFQASFSKGGAVKLQGCIWKIEEIWVIHSDTCDNLHDLDSDMGVTCISKTKQGEEGPIFRYCSVPSSSKV